MKKFLTQALIFTTLPFMSASCVDTTGLESRLEGMEERIENLEEAASIVNSNAMAIRRLAEENVLVVAFTELEHGYSLELSDGTVITITDGINAPAIVPMIGIDENGNWIMSTDNGETFSQIKGAQNAFTETGRTPQLKVDEDGLWLVSTDGGITFSHIYGANGNPQSATDGKVTGNMSTFFTDVKYDAEKGVLTICLKSGDPIVVPVIETFFLKTPDYKEKDVIYLNYTKEYKVEMSDVEDAFFQVPEGWSAVLTDKKLQITGPSSGLAGEYTVSLVITSSKGYIRHLAYTFTLEPKEFVAENCKIYNDWLEKNGDNVLLDFSYAGYRYGESAPAEASGWGYTVYDVTDYGAVPNDGQSDRAAFIACLEAATGQTFTSGKTTLTLGHKEKANAIIYFPEGEFILHTSEDNHSVDGKDYSQTIQIRSGNIIMRGAGRDKTVIVMKDANLPSSEALYSSPVMLAFKHNSGLGGKASCAVTKNTEKGSFSVEVAGAEKFSPDTWVCLTLKNNDPACVAKELEAGQPTEFELSGMTEIVQDGVQVNEYHRIKKIDGNTVTFYEPIMHDVDIQYTDYSSDVDTNGEALFWNWTVMDYPHYENVGIEDLTFKGFAKDDFVHHGSWEDDGAFKPLQMTRLTDSWLRRVRFTSVSEACSVSASANVSVYDIEFDGNRGHAAIRSQGSSRVFIGATTDKSSGPLVDGGAYEEGAGQYHAVGVSKPSMGAVLWRNRWGTDACFEAHASQPRATLIDCCKGGWVASRQGGDDNKVPNHLDDLTIWNFDATNVKGNWIWWNHNSKWHKFLPPTIVGFHGASTTFDQSEVKVDFSNGTPVYPESLYEAQLKERLGAVPAWLESLK